MKVLAITGAQGGRSIRILSSPIRSFELATIIGDRYKFFRVPKPEEILATEQKGFTITFQFGTFENQERKIPIDAIQVLAYGISVVTRSGTEDCDLVLDDLLSYLHDALKVEFQTLQTGTAHTSLLDVQLEKSLAELLPDLRSVGPEITEGLDEAWTFRPNFELSNIAFAFDAADAPAAAPPIFRLERRSRVPFDLNTYYSEAPLTTAKHIALLENFEASCLRRLGSSSPIAPSPPA